MFTVIISVSGCSITKLQNRVSPYSYGTKQSQTDSTFQYIFCSVSLEINGFKTCPEVTKKTPYTNSNRYSDFNQEFVVDSFIKPANIALPVNTSETKKRSLSENIISKEPSPLKASITSQEKTNLQSNESENKSLEVKDNNVSEEDAFISSYMVFFDFDKSNLSADALATLDDWYPKFKNHKLQIIGFTDDIGPRIHNKALATSRAFHVREFFLGKGFDYKDLNIIGKELCCYLEPNKSEMQRAKNRRVEIRIID